MTAGEQNFSPETPSPASRDTETEPVAKFEDRRPDGPVLHDLTQSGDLAVPWDWFDLFLLVIMAFAGFLLLGVALASALHLVGFSAAHSGRAHTVGILFAIVVQILVDLSLLGYLALQIRFRFRKPFWRTIGWRPLVTEKFPPAIAYIGLAFAGFLLTALVSLVSATHPPSQKLPIETVFQSRPAVILYMMTAVFVAPLVEEVIFRGYLYPVAARSFGVLGGVLFTGTLFGLMHGAQLWGGWWQILLLVFVGIVFTAVRAATRTITSSFTLHLAYNSTQVIAFLVAFFGGHGTPPVQ